MRKRLAQAIAASILLGSLLNAQPPAAPLAEWQTQLIVADSLRKAAQYEEAMALANQALEYTERTFGPEDTSVARALHVLGDCNRRLGELEKAEPLIRRSLAIRERVLGTEDPLVARTLNSLALTLDDLGDFEAAESTHLRVLAMRERMLGPGHPDVAQTLNNLGRITTTLGRMPEAEVYFRRALQINETALGPDDPTVALGLTGLATIANVQGRFDEANADYARALGIRERTLGEDHPEVAETLVNFALLLEDQGDYRTAEDLHTRALHIYESALGDSHASVAATLSNLGGLYTAQGRFSDAEPLFQRAAMISRHADGENNPDLATILNNLAAVYTHQEKYAEAEKLYRQANAIQVSLYGPDDPDVASSFNNLAILYWNQDRFAEAEPLHQKAIKIWETALGPDHPDYADGLDDLGALYLEEGRDDEADALFEQALKIREKALGSEHPDVAASLSNRALVQQRRNNPALAERLQSRAWRIRRQMFEDGFAVLTEKSALEYSELFDLETSNYLTVLAGTAESAMSSSGAVAEVALAGKGRVTEAMLTRNKFWNEPIDSETRAIADSLKLARFALSKLYVDGPYDDFEHYQQEVANATALKERLEADLAKRSESFTREREAAATGPDEILQNLPANAALVEFVRYDHRESMKRFESRYLAVVLRQGVGIAVLPLGAASEIDTAIFWYRRYFENPRQRVPAEYPLLSEGVYSKVWRPLAGYLENASTVFIAPDGNLSLVSFASLLNDQNQFLIEQYALHYLSSGRDLVRLKEHGASGSGLLAIGDPDFDMRMSGLSTASGSTMGTVLSGLGTALHFRSGCAALRMMDVARLPGTRAEVESVVSLWKSRQSEPVLTMTDTAATEDNFKREAAGKRVLHIATHGFYISEECKHKLQSKGGAIAQGGTVSDNPLLMSGLLLAGSNQLGEQKSSAEREDGVVTAEEVAGLNLAGVEMVFLSACETGLGQVISGEGVYGLRRAFQMAGARTVISSLWSIDDKSTAELVGGIFAGDPGGPLEAMRGSMLSRITKLRAEKKNADPFLWAAFVAAGDW